ncbi:MAG: hypothetical protein J7K21_01265, partial [Desulfurococcales archaeon]|nr:hypothetical protein [Desulfurococcales archaeon]
MWIEVWLPNSLWNPHAEPATLIVKEDHKGRMNIIDGGYIAARISVLEYLYNIGRQAKVLILREVDPKYMFPVGNWQIRLTVKHALSKSPVLKNPSIDELGQYISRKFSIPHEVTATALKYVYLEKNRVISQWFGRE